MKPDAQLTLEMVAPPASRLIECGLNELSAVLAREREQGWHPAFTDVHRTGYTLRLVRNRSPQGQPH
jgi:hypothetical protein